MINHARTLLLNALPAPGQPGEEYIPADYKIRAVPPYLAQVRQVLLGHDTPREVQNYRVRQLMTLLHSSNLAQHIYKLDPRVTYWPTADLYCFAKEPSELVPLAKIPDVLNAIAEEDVWTLYAGPDAAPLVCWEYWNDRLQPQDKICGVTLAVIYRMNKLNELGKE